MNDEKQIAQAILDAQKMREESFNSKAIWDKTGLLVSAGEYSKSKEECFIIACKNNQLSPNLWYLLELANSWNNDIQQWAEDILAGKSIYDSIITEVEDGKTNCERDVKHAE